MTARQWQWDVHYPDKGLRLIDTLYLPAGEVVEIRSPTATRPWQHVLEAIGGVMALIDALHLNPERHAGHLQTCGPLTENEDRHDRDRDQLENRRQRDGKAQAVGHNSR